MADDPMLNEAINAVQKGDKARARDLLSRLLKANQSNPDYWLWLSTAVETQRERIYCLREALARDPKNASARRGLVMAGALTGETEALFHPGMVHRTWTVRPGLIAKPTEKRLPFPYTRLVVWSGAGLVAIAMLIYGLIGMGKLNIGVDYRLTVPPTSRPTATLLATNTPYIITFTPTFTGPTPLWMFLEATWTPTPFYGSTTHPRTEAFKSGVTRFDRGDWNGAIEFFKQSISSEPQAADVYYYLGETYRMQGDYPKAIEQYNKSIAVNAGYAPPYLGRARATLSGDAGANVDEDLQQAIARDPGYGEAYLEMADIALHRGDAQAALASLEPAGQYLPDSPLVYLYRATANLMLGNQVEALDQVRQANLMDRTLLPSYRLLGQSFQANDMMKEAISPLQLYIIYFPGDTDALLMLARSYTITGDFENAVKIYSQTIQVDANLLDAYLERGQVYLDQSQPQLAADDFSAALKLDSKSFEATLNLGRALLAQDQARDAYVQFDRARAFAEGNTEIATVYYWRAQALEAIDEPKSAKKDWEALLELPAEDYPQDWADQAQQHLEALYTPTPTPEGGETPTPGGEATPAPAEHETTTPTNAG